MQTEHRRHESRNRLPSGWVQRLDCTLSAVPDRIVHSETSSATRKALYRHLRATRNPTEKEFRVLRHWALDTDSGVDEWRRKIAAGLLPAYAETRFREVLALVLHLAEDQSWGLREDVTWAVRDLFDLDFDAMCAVAADVCASGSDRAARAVAVGLARHCRQRLPEEAEPALQVMNSLAVRSDRYLRRNLGPFAVGDYLLCYYPAQTLRLVVQRWAGCSEQWVRWNAAMCFSTAEGAKHFEQAIGVLRGLANDPRRIVWRAAASAFLSVYRRTAGRPHGELSRWLRDPERQQAAAYVLSFLEGGSRAC
jgi:hypothetical protein